MYGLFDIVDSVLGYSHSAMYGTVFVLVPVGRVVTTFVRSGDAVIGACRAANKVISLVVVVLVANGLLFLLAILLLVYCGFFYSLFLSVFVLWPEPECLRGWGLTQCRSYLADVRLCQVRHADCLLPPQHLDTV